MDRTHRLTFFLLLLLSPAAALFAEDLPPWNDDSGMVVTPYPSRFAPAIESTNLVSRVFHEVDSSVEITWTMVITDANGNEVRHFEALQVYAPGEAMQYAPTWNGGDDFGRLLSDGAYTVTVTADMRGAGPRLRKLQSDESNEPRVRSIQQRFAATVLIDSARRGRPIEAQWQAPNEPGFPFNFYFGTLHNQTSYSDGGHPNDSNCTSSTTHAAGDSGPAQAYSYARNTAHLDFLGITDHNHFFENACPACSAAQVIQRYHDGLSAAANATVDGSFVGIYGMEWGYISTQSFPNEGHVGLFEVPKLFGWEPSGCTIGVDCFYEVYTNQAGSQYPAMYTKALQNPSPWGAFGQFMHPSDGTKSAQGQGVDFNNIQYTTDGDDLIHTAAVISGPATDPSTAAVDTGALYAGEPVNGAEYSAYTSTDMFNRILGAGFHVAPVADPDVHCSNYGTSTRDRVVILANSLTKAALMDAIHRRRVYATSNSNTQLVYTMNAGGTTYYMGDGGIRANGTLPTNGSITLHVSVWDPDAGQTATSIKIKEPVPGNTNGAETVVATATSSPFDYTFTPSTGKHTYYVYVSMNTGDRLWSAPIWINQGAPSDTTPPTTSITSPANGATMSGTINVTASASDNVGVTKVEFYLDNVLQSTTTVSPYVWGWKTNTSANGGHALNSKAYDAAGNIGTSTTVNVTVSNALPIDISGWKLVQANSAKTYVFPAGTTIQANGYLIIARNSSKASFQTFWNVTLAANVGFINTASAIPVINGSENYTLYNAAGTVVDGVTISMSASGLQSVQRKDPCLAANLATSWNVGATTTATPGSGAAPGCGRGVVINEFSDASGSGNYIYEFVELHFDN